MLHPCKSDLRPECSGGVSLWYIAMRAGCAERSEAWVLNYVRLLHANEGFPPPLPHYGIHGQRRDGIRAAVVIIHPTAPRLRGGDPPQHQHLRHARQQLLRLVRVSPHRLQRISLDPHLTPRRPPAPLPS